MSFPTASPATVRWPGAVITASVVAAVYGLGHLSWYLGTPLGQVPVLDQREVLALANAIAEGTLPAEPFYRAPGYALVIAVLRWCGLPAAGLFSAALALGVVFHALNAGLAARLARLWLDERTALIAGLLVALNPVLVHFATQAGDAIPALSAFLAGLVAVASGWTTDTHREAEQTGERRRAESPSPPNEAGVRRLGAPWIVGSVLWAVATVMRPNYFLVWLALPLLAWLGTRRMTTFARLGTLACSLAGVVVFAGVAIWQQQVSGSSGFLPAQGPYNLWAANQPGAHGRYYTQKLALPAELAAINPARAESILLYQRETGDTTSDLTQINPYWRRRFIAHVTQHPGAWLSLLGRKLYALLNDWEQYNNETPAFHLQRSPWLRWNPLSWGWLFAFGSIGTMLLWREHRRVAVLWLIVAAINAGAAVLFFVSARFRLPLVALLSLPAAAALAHPMIVWRRGRTALLLLVGAAAAGVAFSRFDHVRDTSTYVQDHALLARAAISMGDDATAWAQSLAALALWSDHPDARRIAIESYFNRLLTAEAQRPAAASGSAPGIPDAVTRGAEARWRDVATAFLSVADRDEPLRAVAALAWWRAGDRDEAITEWRRLDAQPAALAARIVAGDLAPERRTVQQIAATAPRDPLVQLAVAVSGYGELTPDRRSHLAGIAARVFGQQ